MELSNLNYSQAESLKHISHKLRCAKLAAGGGGRIASAEIQSRM